MEQKNPDLLDINKVKLDKPGVIEASAGTGKTYTITGLVVRLLIGHGCLPLEIERILLVTFTEAATADLRKKVLEKIIEIRDILELALLIESKNLNNCDKFGKDLLEDLFGNEKFSEAIKTKLTDAINRLKVAERKIDNASISTIHSFCQKMLKQNAFESGALFKNKFVENEKDLNTQSLIAMARKYFYRKNLSYFQRSMQSKLGDPAQDKLIENFIRADKILPELDPNFDAETLFQNLKQQLKFYCSYVKRTYPNSNDNKVVDTDAEIDKLPEEDIENLCSLIRSYKFYNDNLKRDKNKPLSKAKKDYKSLKDFLLYLGVDISHEKVRADLVENIPDFNSDEFFSNIEAYSNAEPFWRQIYYSDVLEKKKNLKSLKNLLSFDDLIAGLRDALDPKINHGNAEVLASRIRDAYPIAMIDEFQDTDKKQYDIFSRVYIEPRKANNAEKIKTRDGYISSIFLIGDPKQAIYRFRGGDIYTYFYAKQQNNFISGQNFTMGTNFRSSSRMVSSVNTIFEKSKVTEKNTFITNKIGFNPVDANGTKKYLVWASDRKKIEANPSLVQSFEISPVVYSEVNDFINESEVPSSKIEKKYIANSCAFQLHKLLTEALFAKNSQDGIIFEKLNLSDFAILVMKQSEAQLLKNSLNMFGIDSVYLSDQSNVDDSKRENSFIRHFMEAIIFIHDTQKVRCLITDPLMGLTLEETNLLINSATLYERFMNLLGNCSELWTRHGFMSALYCFVNDPIVDLFNRQRKCSGEQVITNILHIGEIVQTEETKQSSVYSLYSWFVGRNQTDEKDEVKKDQNSTKIRLKSDKDIVSIVTVFKSKGLEYPIVMLPFISEEYNISDKEPVMYHPEENDNCPPNTVWHMTAPKITTYDNKNEKSDSHTKNAKCEILEEKIRLLYVALTRARYCNCFVISTGRKYRTTKQDLNSDAFKGFERNSLLGMALQQRYKEPDEGMILQGFWDKYLKELAANYPNESMYMKISKENDSYMYNTVVKGRPSEVIKKVTEISEQDGYGVAVFEGKVDRKWAITSYSYLNGSSSKAKPLRYNELPAETKGTEELANETTEDSQNGYVMNQFSFPHGSKPGDFLHNLLENRDFQYDSDGANNSLESQGSLEDYIKDKVSSGFFADSKTLSHWREPEGIKVLTDWFKNIVSQPLFIENEKSICLKDIDMMHRLSESEFTFSLGNLKKDRVNEFYKKYYDSKKWLCALLELVDNKEKDESNKIYPFGNFEFRSVNGLLTGKIDLIFSYDSKFYIVDYKSNYLGDKLENYSRTNMAAAVAEHRYDFQYSIYALALYRFLKIRKPNLDFSKCFGGVMYLFLRGMNKDNHPTSYDRDDALSEKQIFGCYDVKLPNIEKDNSFIEELDKIFSDDNEDEENK